MSPTPLLCGGVSMAPHPKPSKIWQTCQTNVFVFTCHTSSGKGLSFHMSNCLGWDSWQDNMFFLGFSSSLDYSETQNTCTPNKGSTPTLKDGATKFLFNQWGLINGCSHIWGYENILVEPIRTW
jgi:hypothetical protein